MPSEKRIETDALVIGGGIGGLAVALELIVHGYSVVLLAKHKPAGEWTTTHAATGILAPRIDYMKEDEELVRLTALENVRWREMFYDLVAPARFIMPLGPHLPYPRTLFRAVSAYYESIVSHRLGMETVARHGEWSRRSLLAVEPKLRTDGLDGALWFDELIADMDDIVNRLIWQISKTKQCDMHFMCGNVFPLGNGRSAAFCGPDAERVIVAGKGKKLPIVNAAGPWAGQVAQALGASVPVKNKLGIQIQFPGKNFKAGNVLVTFAKDGKYILCMQKSGYMQVGPTNTSFSGSPDDIAELVQAQIPPAIEYLSGAMGSLLNPIFRSEPKFLRAGLRPCVEFIPDTHRPVIFSHENIYSVFPGKIPLAFAMAEEVIFRMSEDGILERRISVLPVLRPVSLDGNKRFWSRWLVLQRRIVSHMSVGLGIMRAYLKNTLSPAIRKF